MSSELETNMKMINDDCIQAMRKIESNSVDFIITDPPYNLGNFMRDRQTNLKKMRSNFFGDAGWDDLEYEDWVNHMGEFFFEANRVLKEKGAMIVFMSLIKIETLIKIATSHKLYYKTTGIWHKKNPMPRNMNLHFINSTEGWVYFINKGKTGTFNNDGRAIHDFVETPVAGLGEKKFGGHPTQKPEVLFEHFVNLLTSPGELILDPFMGSGTTGVVAKKLSRRFIGIELNEVYYESAIQRIKSTKVTPLQLTIEYKNNEFRG